MTLSVGDAQELALDAIDGDRGALKQLLLALSSGNFEWEADNSPRVTVLGADPTGVIDSTSAIQSAIDEAITNRSSVYLPYGTYRITTSLKIPEAIKIYGDGDQQTIILLDGAIYGIVVEPQSSDPIFRSGGMFDLQVQGTSVAKGGLRLGHETVFTRSVAQFKVKRCRFTGFDSSTVTHVNNTGEVMTGAAGIVDVFSQSCTFEEVYSYSNYIGYWAAQPNSGPTTHTFRDCNFRINTLYGQWFWSGTNILLDHDVWEGNKNCGLRIGGGPATFDASPKAFTILLPYFEANNRDTVDPGEFAMLVDAPFVTAEPSQINVFGGTVNWDEDRKGIKIDKGRHCMLQNQSFGRVVEAGITTTNSTNTLVVGGKDDAVYDLDDNTVHMAFDGANGGFMRFDGGVVFRVGRGAARPRVDGTLIAEGNVSSTTAVTTEEVLKEYTVPADTFQTIGHALKVKVFGTVNANGNAKTIRIKFNGITVVSNDITTAPNGDTFSFDVVISFHGSTDFWCFGEGVVGNVPQTVKFVTLASTDPTTDLDIEVTGQNGVASAGDIRIRQFHVQTVNEY